MMVFFCALPSSSLASTTHHLSTFVRESRPSDATGAKIERQQKDSGLRCRLPQQQQKKPIPCTSPKYPRTEPSLPVPIPCSRTG
uniref:Putative secreted protein n=1 Tax=Anopheles darlingi TaxID=43151 RepID=A0A2M4D1A0_ANODA